MGRPTRTRKPVNRYTDQGGPAREWKSDIRDEITTRWKSESVANLAWTLNTGTWTDDEVMTLRACLAELDADEIAHNPTLAFIAKKRKRNPDAPSLWEAMASDQSDDWWKAMNLEIDSLKARHTWNVVPRSVA